MVNCTGYAAVGRAETAQGVIIEDQVAATGEFKLMLQIKRDFLIRKSLEIIVICDALLQRSQLFGCIDDFVEGRTTRENQGKGVGCIMVKIEEYMQFLKDGKFQILGLIHDKDDGAAPFIDAVNVGFNAALQALLVAGWIQSEFLGDHPVKLGDGNERRAHICPGPPGGIEP